MCRYVILLLLFLPLAKYVRNIDIFSIPFGPYDKKYAYFPESQRLELLDETRKMFSFGYDNYMKHAFPLDELDPIHCTGRGPDRENPSVDPRATDLGFSCWLRTGTSIQNTAFGPWNRSCADGTSVSFQKPDVLVYKHLVTHCVEDVVTGDYALTLVDTLDTLAVIGNISEFQHAVQLVIEHVSFDKNNTVQVFEATIRVLGALLSAHLLITDELQPFGNVRPPGYDGELLSMAHDLAARLLPAFDHSSTGIPHPRVNLRYGVPEDSVNQTCTAGAGTLLLEFGILSRLLGDPVYESVARRSMEKLWHYRSNVTGLFGNVIDIHTGEWKGHLSGLGAGIDSFFEYMFKAFIIFGEEIDFHRFSETYEIIKFYMRKGRKDCNSGTGFPPIYVNVDMKNGETINNWIDSLQAAWAGVQVLAGDLEEAICSHALFYSLWQRFGALPERYNWHLKTPEVFFYPLRPELVESTYLLYQATKNPFYLHVGKDILNSLNNYTKVKCGYATIHDVRKKDLEDRMESFFLSETCKYLYLLFDKDNPLNKQVDYLFSTEGHIFPVHSKLRKKNWEEDGISFNSFSSSSSSSSSAKKTSRKVSPESDFTCSQTGRLAEKQATATLSALNNDVTAYISGINKTFSCDKVPEDKRYLLPIKSQYLQQLELLVGLSSPSGHLTCG